MFPLGSLRAIQVPLGKSPPSLGVSALVLDTFTDTNGTSLDAHTPDTDVEGGGWLETIGDFDIQSNKANTSSVTAFSVIDSGQSDVVVTCTVNSGAAATGRPGINGRYTGQFACWIIYLRVGAADDFTLAEVNGATTIRAFTGVTLDPGTDYDVEATFDGTTITATLDGGNQISYNSASFNQAIENFGLYNFNANNSTYDDFQIVAV